MNHFAAPKCVGMLNKLTYPKFLLLHVNGNFYLNVSSKGVGYTAAI